MTWVGPALPHKRTSSSLFAFLSSVKTRNLRFGMSCHEEQFTRGWDWAQRSERLSLRCQCACVNGTSAKTTTQEHTISSDAMHESTVPSTCKIS